VGINPQGGIRTLRAFPQCHQLCRREPVGSRAGANYTRKGKHVDSNARGRIGKTHVVGSRAKKIRSIPPFSRPSRTSKATEEWRAWETSAQGTAAPQPLGTIPRRALRMKGRGGRETWTATNCGGAGFDPLSRPRRVLGESSVRGPNPFTPLTKKQRCCQQNTTALSSLRNGCR